MYVPLHKDTYHHDGPYNVSLRWKFSHSISKVGGFSLLDNVQITQEISIKLWFEDWPPSPAPITDNRDIHTEAGSR